MTGTPLRSSLNALCPGKLIDCALKFVSVAFFACGSFFPTLSLARLKSMPTPGFFLRFFGIIPCPSCFVSRLISFTLGTERLYWAKPACWAVGSSVPSLPRQYSSSGTPCKPDHALGITTDSDVAYRLDESLAWTSSLAQEHAEGH